jgi:hypothetical protein
MQGADITSDLWKNNIRVVDAVTYDSKLTEAKPPVRLPNMHQQNQVNLDSLDRAVQRSIESQKLQKGALLYSSAQYPTRSVQLCVGLSLSVGLCTEWPKTETWIIIIIFGLRYVAA